MTRQFDYDEASFRLLQQAAAVKYFPLFVHPAEPQNQDPIPNVTRQYRLESKILSKAPIHDDR
ncbi:hypothetical protein FOQG_08344 [Fusarium oxysporum f. sp. raphani 54005]|uniref:Uncharacterized protein n=2 Tax=Fusarium oxysporum TaxID=5507 RepID=X0C293_FUSOX|nr:hypothetical protein FOVG_02338 [Fusarium oxysporum f. sp. pisi HDV247]EXK88535.1 hypothetical protein FOQG_08344 [Fusarium oxysporum f. sp. raphani 54005]